MRPDSFVRNRSPRWLALAFISGLMLSLSSVAQAQVQLIPSAEPEEKFFANHTVYLDMTRYILAMVGTETPMISANYEYRMVESPIAWLGALRLGLLRDQDTDWSYGLGLGMRRYLYSQAEGAFLQLSCDIGGSEKTDSPRKRYGLAALEYGYKVVERDFIIGLHGGPQFYGFTDSKEVSLTFGIDLGFPLSSRSFQIP